MNISLYARLTLLLLLGLLPVRSTVAQAGVNTSVLNPNLATEEDLVALPQVDADLAAALVAARPFLSMLDLHAVVSKTLGETEWKALYPKLFVPINLNTATREEILLVPGVGERMAHEFEEYRPYRALAEFRREIGKYVDEEEVARLEQYVFVPISLNKASDEDILSIPGVGRRMLHEFKEYRPYKSLAQFDREIGKYVDAKEVARLRRYVTL